MNKASEAADKTADAVERVGNAIGHETGDEFHDRAQSWADALQNTANAAASAEQGIALLTAEQLRGLREVAQELQAGGLSLEQYEQRIQEVMTGTSQAIERQAEQLRQNVALMPRRSVRLLPISRWRKHC